MNKVAAAVAVIVAIAGLFTAGGSATNWTFDFSTNTETNISDDDTTNILNNLNIDLNELRKLCGSIEVPEQYVAACDVLDILP